MPTSRHNTTLPFTRAIAGAYDYTICWTTPRLKTTHPHQMAQSVIASRVRERRTGGNGQ